MKSAESHVVERLVEVVDGQFSLTIDVMEESKKGKGCACLWINGCCRPPGCPKKLSSMFESTRVASAEVNADVVYAVGMDDREVVMSWHGIGAEAVGGVAELYT